MAMFVVSACSTAASPAPSSPAASTAAQSQAPASAPAEAKTLTVWLMNGSASDDLVKQLNTEFEAAHPGVTVKYEV
jgi:N,N'-diacetylchitobiose transport system substrate-binding protein